MKLYQALSWLFGCGTLAACCQALFTGSAWWFWDAAYCLVIAYIMMRFSEDERAERHAAALQQYAEQVEARHED